MDQNVSCCNSDNERCALCSTEQKTDEESIVGRSLMKPSQEVLLIRLDCPLVRIASAITTSCMVVRVHSTHIRRKGPRRSLSSDPSRQTLENDPQRRSVAQDFDMKQAGLRIGILIYWDGIEVHDVQQHLISFNPPAITS